MYNSYPNRNQAPEQVNFGALQQVLRADQQQNQMQQQSFSGGYGYAQQASYSPQALQQVMQADRQAQQMGMQQQGISPYGASSQSQGYGQQGYGQQGRYGQSFQSYTTPANPAALNQIMQADHTGQFGPSVQNYNTPYAGQQQSYANAQLTRSSYGQYAQPAHQPMQGTYPAPGLHQVMQADHFASGQGQMGQSYGSAYAYAPAQQMQAQPQPQPQHFQSYQGQPQGQAFNPGLSQVMRADQQGFSGPSRQNYNI